MAGISFADVEAAARRINRVVHHTPVFHSRTLDALVGGHVYAKAECLQRGGAFKFRGAYNKLAALPEHIRARGVVAYSSGNHGQAVAIAARLLRTTATVLMPSDALASKVEATSGYGAHVIFYDRWTDDREQIAASLAQEFSLALVKPFDDPYVMAGQGTVALELLEYEPELNLLLIPVGGGGLIAGCATATKSLDRRIRVVGVEPEASNDTERSLAAGKRINVGVPSTIADGLQAAEPGELTFEVNRRLVDAVVTVTEAEILDAMAFLFERLKLVVEPSGAVGIAALMNRSARGKNVGVVLSGGNVDAARFADLLMSSGSQQRPSLDQ